MFQMIRGLKAFYKRSLLPFGIAFHREFRMMTLVVFPSAAFLPIPVAVFRLNIFLILLFSDCIYSFVIQRKMVVQIRLYILPNINFLPGAYSRVIR